MTWNDIYFGSANCELIEGCLGEKGGFSILPVDPSDFFYFNILAAYLFGVCAAFFLELLLLYLLLKTLFSDYFFNEDLSTEVFPASSIINGDANFAIASVDFFFFEGERFIFSSTVGRFDYIVFFIESDNFRLCP